MFKKVFKWIKSIINEINEYRILEAKSQRKAIKFYAETMVINGLPTIPHYITITKLKSIINKFFNIIAIVTLIYVMIILITM